MAKNHLKVRKYPLNSCFRNTKDQYKSYLRNTCRFPWMIGMMLGPITCSSRDCWAIFSGRYGRGGQWCKMMDDVVNI